MNKEKLKKSILKYTQNTVAAGYSVYITTMMANSGKVQRNSTITFNDGNGKCL